jgi:hypothetical protein
LAKELALANITPVYVPDLECIFLTAPAISTIIASESNKLNLEIPIELNMSPLQ